MGANQDVWPGNAGYAEGFYVEAPSGAYRFNVGGLFQVRGTVFEGGLSDRASGMEVERGRLELSGLIEERLLFRFDPNFREGSHELEEGWLGVNGVVEGAILSAGRTREPFGLEENIDLKTYDFATYSLLNQFSPQQDDGVTLRGELNEGEFEYAVGVYKDTGAGRYRDDDDFAARLIVHPFLDSSNAEGLQFGLATTIGRADQNVAGEALITEAQVPFARFAPGSRLNGRRVRLGAEAAWLEGPFALYAEWMQVQDRVQGTRGSSDAETSGFYLGATWVLTGESKFMDSPLAPYRPTLTGQNPLLTSGAWQLAFRYSDLSLDEAFSTAGLLNSDASLGPVTHPGDVSTLDFGVNWYPSRHIGVKLHMIRTEYDRNIALGDASRRAEDALVIQLQSQF